jgi:glutamate-5-semialdehyde dehydrogenase
VTIDAFALCFKAGNACILKGGRESAGASRVLAQIAGRVLLDHGCPAAAITQVPELSREGLKELLKLDQYIDLVIPRGGTELIKFVREHSKIPTVQHAQGVNHIFVDAWADLEMAVRLCVSAKASAPATCNSAECVLVHRSVAHAFLPAFAAACAGQGIEIRACERSLPMCPGAVLARDDDWGREFLELVVAVRVVESMDAAIEHIHRYSSNHTEAIVTGSDSSALAFTSRVQSSCTLVNASTRFNDGFQLGLGAEIGISTSRVHAYGPMGLEELTTQRYVVIGHGQTR